MPPVPSSTKPASCQRAAVERSVELRQGDAPAGRGRGARSRSRRRWWVRRRRTWRRRARRSRSARGAAIVPRAAIFSVVSPSARTTSVKSESTATFRWPSGVDGQSRRSPVSADRAGRVDRADRSGQGEAFDRRVPPASAMSDGSLLAERQVATSVSCSSGKVIRPSSAVRSARVADIVASRLTRPCQVRRCARKLRDVEALHAGGERRRAAAARNVDRQRREAPRAAPPGGADARDAPVGRRAARCELLPPATRVRTVRFVSPGLKLWCRNRAHSITIDDPDRWP